MKRGRYRRTEAHGFVSEIHYTVNTCITGNGREWRSQNPIEIFQPRENIAESFYLLIWADITDVWDIMLLECFVKLRNQSTESIWVGQQEMDGVGHDARCGIRTSYNGGDHIRKYNAEIIYCGASRFRLKGIVVSGVIIKAEWATDYVVKQVFVLQFLLRALDSVRNAHNEELLSPGVDKWHRPCNFCKPWDMHYHTREANIARRTDRH